MRKGGYDYRELIGEAYELIRRLPTGRADIGSVIQALSVLRDGERYEIHEVWAVDKTAEDEACIRAEVKRIAGVVLPYIEAWRREVKDEETDVALRGLYDDFYALVAFRSLKHFALYMEWDKSDNEAVWRHNLNCFEGYWYYMNSAILDRRIKCISKQLPTGYGKSYSDTVAIAFTFGYNVNSTILKVTGNPSMVNDGAARLIKFMASPRYAKVFPYYEKFGGKREYMYDVCQVGGINMPARLVISGANVGTSFMYINKETPIDGGRYDWLYMDDVTRSKDKNNITQHEKDIDAYRDCWSKRKSSDGNFCQAISGTTYSQYDIISYVKKQYGGDEAEVSKVNKYTKINKETQSVFVSVPKLDFDTDECTFPHKYTTEKARQDRADNLETFMAMDQQMPLPPAETPFHYDKIQVYEHIPAERESGCWATLDPARTGKNYVSMPIFAIGKDGLHYLKDCIYELKPMEEVHQEIIEKIERHHITRLNIERNTDTSLATFFKRLLEERGITYCDITEVYTYKQKENKIADMQATIINNMVFPKQSLYAGSSQMGKFMLHFVTYSYFHKVAFDDSPDSLAMYAEKFISGKRNIKAKAKLITRV